MMIRSGAFVLVALLVSMRARAQSPETEVVLVADGAPGRIAARVRAELRSAGFRVIDASSDAPHDVARPRLWLDTAAERIRIVASAPTGGADPIELTAVLGTEGLDAAAAVALRAVELLNASLAAAAVAQARREASAAPAVAAAPGPAAAPARRARVDVGATGLHTPAGLGPAIGPHLALAVSLTARLHARAWMRAPMFAESIARQEGSASLRREAAGMDLCGVGLLGSGVRPFVCAGAGLHRLSTSGSARDDGHLGRSGSVLSWMASVGAGAIVDLTTQVGLTIEGHTSLLGPNPVVVIADQRAGDAGWPLLGATIGVSVALDGAAGR